MTGLNVLVITNCRHEAGAKDEEAMFYNLDEIFWSRHFPANSLYHIAMHLPKKFLFEIWNLQRKILDILHLV